MEVSTRIRQSHSEDTGHGLGMLAVSALKLCIPQVPYLAECLERSTPLKWPRLGLLVAFENEKNGESLSISSSLVMQSDPALEGSFYVRDQDLLPSTGSHFRDPSRSLLRVDQLSLQQHGTESSA
jgi:hypothetical protein